MATPTPASFRSNILILALGQALALSAIALSVTLSAILGAMLAPDKGLATLPLAAMVIGTTLASLPAARLMHRIGRRLGFMLRMLLGIGGSLLCALALHQSSFVVFTFGHFLLGAYQGFANYYRFAAVEATGPAQAGKAISLVIAGGIVAAFLGPQLGLWGRDWIGGQIFVGSYLAQGVLSLAALLLLTSLWLPKAVAAQSGSARPLREILSQPALRVSIFGTAIGLPS